MASREVYVLLWALGGCPAPAQPPTPPATPPVEEPNAPATAVRKRVATGKACVFAEMHCDVAMCAAEIHNECSAAIACDLEVVADCHAGNASKPARGHGHDTLAADTATTLEATVDCGGLPVGATRAEKLSCH